MMKRARLTSFSAPENIRGITIHLGKERFEVLRRRDSVIETPPPIPVVPVERPKAAAGIEAKLGDRRGQRCCRLIKPRPGQEERDRAAADTVSEPGLMLNVRK